VIMPLSLPSALTTCHGVKRVSKKRRIVSFEGSDNAFACSQTDCHTDCDFRPPQPARNAGHAGSRLSSRQPVFASQLLWRSGFGATTGGLVGGVGVTGGFSAGNSGAGCAGAVDGTCEGVGTGADGVVGRPTRNDSQAPSASRATSAMARRSMMTGACCTMRCSISQRLDEIFANRPP